MRPRDPKKRRRLLWHPFYRRSSSDSLALVCKQIALVFVAVDLRSRSGIKWRARLRSRTPQLPAASHTRWGMHYYDQPATGWDKMPQRQAAREATACSPKCPLFTRQCTTPEELASEEVLEIK